MTVSHQLKSPDGNRSTRKSQKQTDDSIEWRDYPRIAPGQYSAYCYWANRYRDRGIHRWTCLLRWDVLSDNLADAIAHCVPLWFHLGDREKPYASRRGKYLREWVRANDRPPTPGDRLSPRVFTRRIARVEIGDTKSPVPYSVVKKILHWQTGSQRYLVSKSHSQGRPEITLTETEGCEG